MAQHPVKAKSNTARFRSVHGQSTIEALAVAVALVGFVSVLGAVLYFGMVNVGMNYLIHEFLVCEQTEGTKNCRQELLKASKPFLIFATLQTIETQNRRGKAQARMVLKMPFRKTMQIKDELGLYR